MVVIALLYAHNHQRMDCYPAASPPIGASHPRRLCDKFHKVNRAQSPHLAGYKGIRIIELGTLGFEATGFGGNRSERSLPVWRRIVGDRATVVAGDPRGPFQGVTDHRAPLATIAGGLVRAENMPQPRSRGNATEMGKWDFERGRD